MQSSPWPLSCARHSTFSNWTRNFSWTNYKENTTRSTPFCQRGPNWPRSQEHSWHARWPHKCSVLQLRCSISSSRLFSPWNPKSDSEARLLHFPCAFRGHSPPPLLFCLCSASGEWRTSLNGSTQVRYLSMNIHLKMAGLSSRLVSRPAQWSPSLSSNSPVFFSTFPSSSSPRNPGPTWEWKERRQSPGK